MNAEGKTIDRLFASFRRRIDRPNVSSRTDLRTTDQVKDSVFKHLSSLDELCRRRFPGNENLAQEGCLYVLNHLEANDWQRVRTWQGSGRFLTYLLTMASRLLTDFSRSKFGHIRMPTWLEEKQDPLWTQAYRLLIIERWDRRDAVELLRTHHPSRERWSIEDVVCTVQARCRERKPACESTSSLEDCAEPVCDTGTPETALGIQVDEMVEALSQLIGSPATLEAHGNQGLTERVNQLAGRLASHIDITEEDRLFLRLRHLDGLKMTEIVRLLGIKGDPYKRYHKILDALRKAWQKAELPRLDDLY